MNAEIDFPRFRIEQVDDHGKVCELLTCSPPGSATHKVTFPDTAIEVLICDRHAVGIVALGEYVTHEPVELVDPGKDA